jgi:hypothetical protein
MASAPADRLDDSTDPVPARPPRARASKLVRHFKVDHRLTPEDRAAYEAKLLDPRQTVNSLHAWLREKGYTGISRTAVHRHRRRFELDVKGIRRDAAVANQYAVIARAQGGAALAEAGQFRFEQMFLEELFRMKKSDHRTGKEWNELAAALGRLLSNRQLMEDQRSGSPGRGPDSRRRAGTRPTDGAALSDKVRRILGMPLPGEPIPGLPPRNGVGEEPGRN